MRIIIMQNNTETIQRLLTARDAAKYLCISERKLWSMTQTEEIPAVRLGRAVRYDKQDLDEFISKAKSICNTEL